MEMVPSPRFASDKALMVEKTAQPVIRQLQGSLMPMLGGPGADYVGLGPATHQLLSQTCLQGSALAIEAVRSRELLYFIRQQSKTSGGHRQ